MSDGPLVRYLKGHGDQDLSLIRRAISQGWPISDEQRQRIVDQLLEILEGDNPMAAVKAARILEGAIANDKRYEIEILKLLQNDQVVQERLTPAGLEVEGEVQRQVDAMTTEEIHRLLVATTREPSHDNDL